MTETCTYIVWIWHSVIVNYNYYYHILNSLIKINLLMAIYELNIPIYSIKIHTFLSENNEM